MSSRRELSRNSERCKSPKRHNYEITKNYKTRSNSADNGRGKSSSRDRNDSTRRISKKKKKKRKKSSSSDSTSSSDSDEEELKLLQRLEAERLRIKEEKKKQKEQMKANETPEEKRARRLREKQEKERKRRERMGWDNEYQCYTNQDNPFGDSALTHSFVWGKKLAQQGVARVSREQLDALARQKQLENKIELEKVKQRRLEREAERAAREAEAAAAARAREAHQFHSWARQEDAFHLRQARLRSQIRIRDGRAKPIDLLAWYAAAEQGADAGADALEMHEPYAYLNGLRAPDLEDLLEDIQVYKELEAEESQPYWTDVETVARAELAQLRRLAAPAARAPDGVHHAVADDVAQVFRGKSGAQLTALREQVRRKLAGGGAGVDVGYWESLLTQLEAHMARARLRERHQNNLRRKLQLLKQEQGVRAAESEASPAPAAADNVVGTPDNDVATSGDMKSGDAAAVTDAARGEDEREVAVANSDAEGSGSGSEAGSEGGEAACVSQYVAGRYSPPPLAARALDAGTLLTEAHEDEARLAYLRAALRARRQAPAPTTAGGSSTASGVEALEREAERAMGAGGAGFSVEHALPDQPCLWADKYRPRKPRYFNRVHTGFEWNKYNQTHYDMDNPPPKVVQGYKFNIFYPDLIDPSDTPRFSLKPCADNPEFAVLRFSAGPPYEDIAFRIVHREWEYSYKRGFRCHFHNNIFQLWFHFKRYRYRR